MWERACGKRTSTERNGAVPKPGGSPKRIGSSAGPAGGTEGNSLTTAPTPSILPQINESGKKGCHVRIPEKATAILFTVAVSVPHGAIVPIPTVPTAMTRTAAVHVEGGPDTALTVVAGDTLAEIAAAHGTTVEAVASANGITDVDMITVGQHLVIPPAAKRAPAPQPPALPDAIVHYVERGDTLLRLVARYGVPVPDILAANPDVTARTLKLGQEITVPGASRPDLPAALRDDPARQALSPLFDRWAAEYGIDANLLRGLCWTESRWRTGAVSPVGAMGLCQFMPGTAAWVEDALGVDLDPWNPSDSIRMSAWYLRHLHGLAVTGGDERLVLVAYNQGHGALAKNGVYGDAEQYAAEVRNYATAFGR